MVSGADDGCAGRLSGSDSERLGTRVVHGNVNGRHVLWGNLVSIAYDDAKRATRPCKQLLAPGRS